MARAVAARAAMAMNFILAVGWLCWLLETDFRLDWRVKRRLAVILRLFELIMLKNGVI